MAIKKVINKELQLDLNHCEVWEVLEKISEAMECINKEGGTSLRFRVDTGVECDSYYSTTSISYQRPMTPEEVEEAEFRALSVKEKDLIHSKKMVKVWEERVKKYEEETNVD